MTEALRTAMATARHNELERAAGCCMPARQQDPDRARRRPRLSVRRHSACC